MIECHSMRHTRAPVMSDDGKLSKSQTLHHLDLILRHHAL
jgi:hypothetical protein